MGLLCTGIKQSKNGKPPLACSVVGEHGLVAQEDSTTIELQLPPGFTPVQESPRLLTINFIGTRLLKSRDLDSTGRVCLGTLYFVCLIPLVPLRRYIYQSLGDCRFQFLAEGPAFGGGKGDGKGEPFLICLLKSCVLVVLVLGALIALPVYVMKVLAGNPFPRFRRARPPTSRNEPARPRPAGTPR